MLSRSLLLFVLPSMVAGVLFKMPNMTEDFSLHLEATISNKNYTIQIREYYDYTNNRVRIESHRLNQSKVTIMDFDSNQQTTLTALTEDEGTQDAEWDCNVTDIGGFAMFMSESQNNNTMRHVKHSMDFFERAADLTYKYKGRGEARGILCNIFTARAKEFTFGGRRGRGPPINLTNTSVTPPPEKHTQFDIDFYFAVPEWKVRYESDTEMPIRAYLKGFNTFGDDNTTQVPFEHTYEFLHFQSGIKPAVMGKSADELFQIECPAAIETKQPTPRPVEAMPPCTSIGVPVFISLIVGLAVGACGGYMAQKKRAAKEHRHMSMVEDHD